MKTLNNSPINIMLKLNMCTKSIVVLAGIFSLKSLWMFKVFLRKLPYIWMSRDVSGLVWSFKKNKTLGCFDLDLVSCALKFCPVLNVLQGCWGFILILKYGSFCPEHESEAVLSSNACDFAAWVKYSLLQLWLSLHAHLIAAVSK